MNNYDKSEKERKKLLLKEKEKEFNKRLGDDPKALKNQSKTKANNMADHHTFHHILRIRNLSLFSIFFTIVNAFSAPLKASSQINLWLTIIFQIKSSFVNSPAA